MNNEQLRQALRELNGQRDAVIHFRNSEPCHVRGAMLVPDEADHLIKLTDGANVFIVDADQVDWIRIGPTDRLQQPSIKS